MRFTGLDSSGLAGFVREAATDETGDTLAGKLFGSELVRPCDGTRFNLDPGHGAG
jgi:hypothetical protein